MTPKTLITGFPRIGGKRELKLALENFWSGKSSTEDLQKASTKLKKKHWFIQKEMGIDLISCNDFSLYDNMLDTIVMLNAIPERFKKIGDKTGQYFAMARGTKDAVAMEMTKWFNTNYHYIVPELNHSLNFSLNASKIIEEYNEAKSLGINPKINIIGPVTFLALSKSEKGTDPYDFYSSVIRVYEELMLKLSGLDETVYVQFEEPVFVKDPAEQQLELLKTAYTNLGSVSKRVKIIVTTYFEHSNEATSVLAGTPIWGIGLDFVHGTENLKGLDKIKNKKLIAGVIDGRNIWANSINKTLDLLETIAGKTSRHQIIISTSCSLLHVPYSINSEAESDIKNYLSFALEKVNEVKLISNFFHGQQLSEKDIRLKEKIEKTEKEKKLSKIINNEAVLRKINSIKRKEREGSFRERISIQKEILDLPELPTTTIGSFPQTPELRKLRRDYKKNIIPRERYEEEIKKYIDDCIGFQEKIGLDVLVHGEPERNDMVEYFGEMLEGFHFTDNGWVQSYGSRCVKPPIIYGDINRTEPMTVKWITHAQSKTKKTVKGMLTGPVTILNWSFVRNDIGRSEVAKQIAVALCDEIDDLQNSGIRIIQVDEAAFKEGYPLRKDNIAEYEKWAVAGFKLAVSKANKQTQIHTHMCYSEFNDIIRTIEAMDVDVITIETARSGNRLLKIFKESGYKNEVGPGVYDIHSPRIPSIEEFREQIKSRMEVLPIEQLWINPDCGLKTRKWEEVKPSLINMVRAVKEIRSVK